MMLGSSTIVWDSYLTKDDASIILVLFATKQKLIKRFAGALDLSLQGNSYITFWRKNILHFC